MPLMRTISLVVPCLNEAEALPFFYREFAALADKMNNVTFEVVLVDDGSRDGTLSIIKNLRDSDKRVHYISFSRNFGKEAAMLAGMAYSKGDYV